MSERLAIPAPLSLRQSVDWREAFVLAASFGLFFLSRPYQGLVGDSVLYIGRGLAALDPAGVGQDPMWRLDGQMRFSLFPLITQIAVHVLGPANAAMTLSIAGLMLWVAGLAALLIGLGQGRALGAIFLACAAFPATYGGFGNIYYGEPVATPRVFAEAASLFSLALLMQGRRRAFWLLSAVGFLLHPIMALGAVACGVLLLTRDDSRWLWGALGVLAAVVVGAALGVPFLSRLVTPLDAEWLSLLRGPAEILFPSAWPLDLWTLKGLQAATVLLAIALTRGTLRGFFVAALLVAAGSLAASCLLADLYPMQLVAQAQLWRANWLLALAAPIGFAIVAPTLWREGWSSRVALSLMAGAWSISAYPIGVCLAAAAVCARLFFRARIETLPKRSIWLLVLSGPALVCLTLLLEALRAGMWTLSLDPSARPPFFLTMQQAYGFTGLAAFAILALAAVPQFRFGRNPAAMGALALCALSVFLWRQEWDPYRYALHRAGRQGDLVEKLSTRPGPVLWLGGNQEAWYWAARPNWAATIQGNGIVFSRELAMFWRDRQTTLRDLGWVTDGSLAPRATLRPDPIFPNVSPQTAAAFCKRDDAPAWILAPVADDSGRPPEAIWRAPARRLATSPDGAEKSAVEIYAIIACAEAR